MKIMLIATVAALSLVAYSASAGENEVGKSKTVSAPYTQTPTDLTDTSGKFAQAPVQTDAPVVATSQSKQTIPIYVAGSGKGTWLFPPNQDEGSNN